MLLYPPSCAHLVWSPRASILWICRQCRHSMPRHLYFGYNCNAPHFSIFHQLLQLLLCEISTLIHRAIHISPLRANLCQQWIFLHLEGPHLVVCQVQMKSIHLEFRHPIHLLSDMLQRHKMPARVHMHPPILESWIILHHCYWQRPLPSSHHSITLYLRRKQLHQSLQTIIHPRCRTTHHLYPISIYK